VRIIISTTLKILNHLKSPSTSPLTKKRGEEKAKAGVLGVRARKILKTNRKEKQKEATLNFCDGHDLRPAQKLPLARVAAEG
jgi:hypothetical protein